MPTNKQKTADAKQMARAGRKFSYIDKELKAKYGKSLRRKDLQEIIREEQGKTKKPDSKKHIRKKYIHKKYVVFVLEHYLQEPFEVAIFNEKLAKVSRLKKEDIIKKIRETINNAGKDSPQYSLSISISDSTPQDLKKFLFTGNAIHVNVIEESKQKEILANFATYLEMYFENSKNLATWLASELEQILKTKIL